jgi:hypothetical protein
MCSTHALAGATSAARLREPLAAAAHVGDGRLAFATRRAGRDTIYSTSLR